MAYYARQALLCQTQKCRTGEDGVGQLHWEGPSPPSQITAEEQGEVREQSQAQVWRTSGSASAILLLQGSLLHRAQERTSSSWPPSSQRPPRERSQSSLQRHWPRHSVSSHSPRSPSSSSHASPPPPHTSALSSNTSQTSNLSPCTSSSAPSASTLQASPGSCVWFLPPPSRPSPLRQFTLSQTLSLRPLLCEVSLSPECCLYRKYYISVTATPAFPKPSLTIPATLVTTVSTLWAARLQTASQTQCNLLDTSPRLSVATAHLLAVPLTSTTPPSGLPDPTFTPDLSTTSSS